MTSTISLESNIPTSGFATLQIEYIVTVEQVSHEFSTGIAVKKGPITKFELHKKEPTKLELQKNELTKLELHKLEPIQKRTLLQIWSQNIYFRTLFLKLFI